MWEDGIVEEVHAIRAQLLARFGGDLHKYCEYVRAHPKPATPDADGTPSVLLKRVDAAITPPPHTPLP